MMVKDSTGASTLSLATELGKSITFFFRNIAGVVALGWIYLLLMGGCSFALEWLTWSVTRDEAAISTALLVMVLALTIIGVAGAPIAISWHRQVANHEEAKALVSLWSPKVWFHGICWMLLNLAASLAVAAVVINAALSSEERNVVLHIGVWICIWIIFGGACRLSVVLSANALGRPEKPTDLWKLSSGDHGLRLTVGYVMAMLPAAGVLILEDWITPSSNRLLSSLGSAVSSVFAFVLSLIALAFITFAYQHYEEQARQSERK